jgi:glycogen operon protein
METTRLLGFDATTESISCAIFTTREFKAMVKAFHDVGMKVFIDVVYNHTGEGGAWNPSDKTVYNLLSFRGLDNPTYYSLTADMQFSWDNTGGRQFHHP